ncbi:uncharacterized protein [Apteryx mantelli]|uniref:Uncharacterized protein n=1 Tax=Apteryx mantelli TaxID=2696672 RepID=A0ABM4FXC9_9AVES
MWAVQARFCTWGFTCLDAQEASSGVCSTVNIRGGSVHQESPALRPNVRSASINVPGRAPAIARRRAGRWQRLAADLGLAGAPARRSLLLRAPRSGLAAKPAASRNLHRAHDRRLRPSLLSVARRKRTWRMQEIELRAITEGPFPDDLRWHNSWKRNVAVGRPANVAGARSESSSVKAATCSEGERQNPRLPSTLLGFSCSE